MSDQFLLLGYHSPANGSDPEFISFFKLRSDALAALEKAGDAGFAMARIYHLNAIMPAHTKRFEPKIAPVPTLKAAPAKVGAKG